MAARNLNRMFRIIMGVFVFASVAISGFLYHRLDTHGLAAMDAWLADARPWFTGLRLTLLGAVIGGWGWWVRRLADDGGLTETERQRALSLRWRIAGWLVCLDLLLAEGLWHRIGEQLRAILED